MRSREEEPQHNRRAQNKQSGRTEYKSATDDSGARGFAVATEGCTGCGSGTTLLGGMLLPISGVVDDCEAQDMYSCPEEGLLPPIGREAHFWISPRLVPRWNAVLAPRPRLADLFGTA